MARIIALSDIHLSPTHGFFWENWCIARNFTTMLGAEAVILNGDLCINGPDSDAEIAFAASALRKLSALTLVLPGNHDVGDEPPGQDEDQIVNAERLLRWQRAFGADRWSLEVAGWQLIGVNAQLFGSGLPQESDQDDWINQQLAAVKAKPIALFLHKPLFLETPDETLISPGCMTPTPRKALLAKLRASGVRLVVSGHLHQYRDRIIDGIRHVWLPAVAFAAATDLSGDSRCGLAVFNFSQDQAEIHIEYPFGMCSHDLDAIKQHGRYAFLRDMPPCPPRTD